MYQPRFYRQWYRRELQHYRVCYRETDLSIHSDIRDRENCFLLIKKLREKLDDYLEDHREFLTSLKPVTPGKHAFTEVEKLCYWSKIAGVGPMAAVAGLFAEEVGQFLLTKKCCKNVFVENGGDIFLAAETDCTIGVYAGPDSPFTGQIGIKIFPEQTPAGICTSSGRVGPSLSKGQADAAVILSRSTLLADAVATAAANKITGPGDIEKTINWARSIEEVEGALITIDDRIGLWGDLEVVKTKL